MGKKNRSRLAHANLAIQAAVFSFHVLEGKEGMEYLEPGPRLRLTVFLELLLRLFLKQHDWESLGWALYVNLSVCIAIPRTGRAGSRTCIGTLPVEVAAPFK
jgi:hypothetical protein